MIRTFLPAQALRTSKKTGGLNSRPSCAWLRSLDGVCLLSLSHVSAGRERPFRGPRYVRRAKHVRLVPQPSRDGAARAVRRLLSGRDTAACMDLHIRDRIPGFHHGCVRARTFRGWRLRFCCYARPLGEPQTRAQSRCGKLNESVGPPRSVSVEACPPAVRGTPHITTMRERPVCYSKTY